MTEADPFSCPNRIPCTGHADAPSAIHADTRARSATRTFDRALWFGAATLGTLILLSARALVPDARGFGTHTQLGLPACAFLQLTGLPCPACGLTTCFAHMARGEFASAARCHPLGMLLFAALLASLPRMVWAGVYKRAFFETLARMHVARICVVLACALFTQWVVRVACLLLR